MDADLVLIHGFWSSPATWDRLIARLQEDTDLAGLRIHAFGYESPKLRWPGSSTRIPDYNDIAQSLPAYLAAHVRGGAGVAVLTHSQGGLIVQRYLAWMLAEGRGRELAKIRLIVMLSCPNEGSEYLRSIRAVAGLGRHPQAGQLDVLTREVGEARRVVLRQVMNATTVDDRYCPIPVYVYSGRTDNVVLRETAQSVFPNAEVLPGNHFSILDPDAPGNLTFAELKRRLLETFTPETKAGTACVGNEGSQAVLPVPETSQEAESHTPTVNDVSGPDDGWRQNAVVDHDRLFGVDRLIGLVVAAVASPSANWIVSLFGDGGIGKTTAAYEATARCAAERRFSRIAWVSATNVSAVQVAGSGASPGVIYWLDLVRGIAEQVGVELSLSRSLWEQDLAEGIAGLDQRERILTVIDNLESTEDAEGIVGRLQDLGLVRPHKVVVTTRWSMQSYSASVAEFPVPSLRRTDSINLIRHLGRGDRDLEAVKTEALDPMLAVTEGNPFLIKLVIRHYLATHRSLQLIISELTELREETESAGASLGHQVREHLYLRSLNELTDQFGLVSHKLMSSFCTKDRGDSFSYPELAAVSGINESGLFDRVLECACRLALVRSTNMNQSYSIHSLLHEFTCRRT